MMANRDDFTRVPPPTSLDPQRPTYHAEPLSSLLSWRGVPPARPRDMARPSPKTTAPPAAESTLTLPASAMVAVAEGQQEPRGSGRL